MVDVEMPVDVEAKRSGRKVVVKHSRQRLKSVGERMVLTERDRELLQFINDFGFCEMPQLDARFGLKHPRNYQLVKRLVAGGYLKHERLLHGRHGVLRLTPRGAKLTTLPAIKQVSLGTYHHDLTLIRVYLQLRARYPEATWLSERQLRCDKHYDGVGKTGHLPDGILVFPDGKQVAVEVELTLKSRYRLESILKGYGGAFEYQEVWYYCASRIVAPMASMAAKWPFIKIYGLEEILGHEQRGVKA